MSRACDGRPKLKLLLTTAIWVDVASPRVPWRDIRTYGGLEQHFDVTWTLTGGTANKGEHPLPADAGVVFVGPVRSKWHYFFVLFPKYVKVVLDALRTNDVALVLGPIELTSLPALVAARLRRRPSVLLVIAPVSALDFFRRPFNRRMASFLLNLEVLLSTEALLLNRHLTVGILPPLRKRLRVLTLSPISEEDFLPIVGPSPDGRAELLFVGRLVEYKRIDVAIETVSRLRREGVEATLTVVGEGADQPRLERLSEELGLSDVVDFVGWTEDPVLLRDYYRRAFALLLPSEIEAFGMVVLEAMAAGTPVVRTAPTEGFDALEAGVDVLVVPTGSAELFAGAVKRLHSDPEFYLRITRAAQAKARSLTREAWQQWFCEQADRLIKERRR